MCCLNAFGELFANVLYVTQRLATCLVLTALVGTLVLTLLFMLFVGVGIGYQYCVVAYKTLPLEDHTAKPGATVVTKASTGLSDANTDLTDAETDSTDAETVSTDAETVSTDAETVSTDAETDLTDAETDSTNANTDLTDANSGSNEAAEDSTDATEVPSAFTPGSAKDLPRQFVVPSNVKDTDVSLLLAKIKGSHNVRTNYERVK
ncbi:hypothetical protein O0L34_g6163 [Tuta absoluta]|nr:hypothetical protein O0L34_g6163 [Tuta absoluta]